MIETVSVPLYIGLGKKVHKKHYINLNAYRNWHYMVSNKVKQEYKQRLKFELEGIKFNSKIKLEFVLWKKDKRRTDRANVLSVHEKFFCDALTEYGCIPDDNDNYIESTFYRTGGIDKKYPRVDIIITEILEDEE